MTNLPDEHYVNPRLAALYDLGNGWSQDRDFYLALAGSAPVSILDLGCGTGLLCNAFAALGHDVTGVDPAEAMLDVARSQAFGHRVSWVHSSAQDLETGKAYDLVIMTGHAFQVLLSDSDVENTLEVVKKHLNKGGRLVFETRNPAIDWASRWNTDKEITLDHTRLRESRRTIERTGNIIRFDTSYAFPDETLVSHSVLRFFTCGEIIDFLARAELVANAVWGDWDEGPFDPELSEEMIFEVRRK
jgi:2-polyprenyl-3-methyl-5-hydroxy-6-metoxy-1,4-benzoquinol methylase